MPDKTSFRVLVCENIQDYSPDCFDSTFIWSSQDTNSLDSCISIPAYIELNALSLRDDLLILTEAFSNLEVKDSKSLHEFFSLRNTFSFWWISSFFEKSNFSKSPCFNDSLKVLAFLKNVELCRITDLHLVSSSPVLHKYFSYISQHYDFNLSLQIPPAPKSINITLLLFRSLPYLFQGLIGFFIYLVQRLPLCSYKKSQWENTLSPFTFVSYLTNISFSSRKHKESPTYYNNYWTDLPSQLSSQSISTNWIHLFVPSSSIPNALEARSKLDLLNDSSSFELHLPLETFISPKVILNTLRSWFSVRRRFLSILPNISSSLKSPTFSFLYFLWIDELFDSFIGKASIVNIFYLCLFESAFSSTRFKKKCFYLSESQSWERSLCFSLNKYDHDLPLAFIHTPLRFWDLRFFHSSKFWLIPPSSYPGQYLIGSNGPACTRLLSENGCPTNKIVGVESLRYLHLISNSISTSYHTSQILLVGDYSREVTLHCLCLLSECLTNLSSSPRILFKPHPVSGAPDFKYVDNNITVSSDSLSDILLSVKHVVCPASSSASVDAYLLGFPIVCICDPSSPVIISPLLGHRNVKFIHSSSDLLSALFCLPVSVPVDYSSFFFLELSLRRWKSFFED